MKPTHEPPLSFGRAAQLEVTQPIPERDMRAEVRLMTDPAYQGAYYAPTEAQGHRAIAVSERELTQKIDAIGHTVCELDADDLKVLVRLVREARAGLLAERLTYVRARRGDLTRFESLLANIDLQILKITRLQDKLAKLHTVKS